MTNVKDKSKYFIQINSFNYKASNYLIKLFIYIYI